MAQIDKDGFSGYLIEFMDAQNLSQRQAAELAGVSVTAINRAKNRQDVNAANYIRICDMIGITPESMIVD